MGSGSNGNATFVATERTRILIDAGFSYKRICQRLAEFGEDAKKLDAVIITHEHSDHISGLATIAKKTGATVYLTGPTRQALAWTAPEVRDARIRIESFVAGRTIVLGDIDVDTFTVPHDAVDPIGCCVRWQGFKVGVVTDLGYLPDSVKYHIRGCDLLMIESNYDTEMLRVSPYPFFVRQRVAGRSGHLSNNNVADFLNSDFDRRARTVVLAHLSEHNNHPEIAKLFALEALERAGARETRLHIARQHENSEVFQF